MTKRRLFALCACAAFAVLLALAARPGEAALRPVTVETGVGPDTVRLGDVVTLRYRMWLPRRARVAFPAKPPDDSLHHWREWKTETLVAKGEMREHRLTARFQTYALGPVSVASLPVRFRISGEPPREGLFPIARFVVVRTAPPTGPPPPLRDLKALASAPWWALVPWLWVAVGLAVLIALIVAIWRWRRRRKKTADVVEADVPLDPPHIEARKRLEALIAKRLPESGRVLEHGVELADLLHRFVERRFGSLQPGHTTSELVRRLDARADVERADVITLSGILEACDLTKFARRPYDVSRAHAAEAEASALITAWTERPAAAAPAAAAGGSA